MLHTGNLEENLPEENPPEGPHLTDCDISYSQQQSKK